MESNPIPTDNRPEWLRSLSETSWNLELVISGAAIFLASYLPDAVDAMLRYYLENLVMDENFPKIILPLLVYSFMKVVAWLLILTFVVHFVMRAFWAGVVGLHAVYTQGIRYEHLPWQSEFSKEQLRERFGTLSDYILRLDRLCNQVFSTAFLIALISLGICMAYIFIFLAINVLPVFLGPKAGRRVSMIILGAIMLLVFLPIFTQWAMRVPRLAALPWVQRLTKWSVHNASYMVMPLVYGPMSYINMTFTSHIPKKKLVRTILIGSVIVMGGVLLTLTSTMLHLSGRTAFTTRDFYAKDRGPNMLSSGVYDNMRSPQDRLPPVSIPSEITEGPFLRVFVDYPKMLDAALSQRCAMPPLPDSISKQRRRVQMDSAHIACMTDFFRLSVNDSIIAQPGWMFHEHPVAGSPGVVAYLPSTNFKNGKNVLTVLVPSSKKLDSLRVYGQVPFWYAPK
ncbi:MAG: hypothetical protein H7246_11715 [Phycisphaerae bacterium]|nr:hypothetical protein [Saprospiraceae bacterium]